MGAVCRLLFCFGCWLGFCTAGLNLLQQEAELKRFVDLAQGVFIQVLALQQVHIQRDGNVQCDCSQPITVANLLLVLRHFLLYGTFEFVCSLQESFHAAKLLNQIGGRLLPHSRASGYVVGGVSHEAQDVDDLSGILNAPFLAHLVRTHSGPVALAYGRTQHGDALGDELPVVLVGRDHDGLNALFVSLMSQGADDVVGFVSGHFQDGDAIGLQNLLDDGHRKGDGFRRLFALRLIAGKGFVAEGSAMRIEGDADV